MTIGRLGNVKQSPLMVAYMAHRDQLKRFLQARLGSEDEAEDLLQELFLRLERQTNEDHIENAIGYLYKVALNVAHDYRRGRSRARARDGQWVEASRVVIGTEAVADLPIADDTIAAKQRLNAVVAALNELSPQCRRVFTLHKFEGLSHLQVAERLGISRSTVEKHMTTALKHLVRRVGRD